MCCSISTGRFKSSRRTAAHSTAMPTQLERKRWARPPTLALRHSEFHRRSCNPFLHPGQLLFFLTRQAIGSPQPNSVPSRRLSRRMAAIQHSSARLTSTEPDSQIFLAPPLPRLTLPESPHCYCSPSQV